MKKRLFVVLVILVLVAGSVGVYGLKGQLDPAKGVKEGGATSKEGSGPELYELIPGKKIPKVDVIFFAEVNANDEVTGWKNEKAGYDPKTGIWTDFEGDRYIYSENGRMVVSSSNAKSEYNVRIWDGTELSFYGERIPSSLGDKITNIEEKSNMPILHFSDDTVKIGTANPIPKTVYDKYKSMIDFSEPSVSSGDVTAIPLIGGQFSNNQVIYSKDTTGVGVTKTSIDGKQEIIWVLPDGKELKSEDGWERPSSSPFFHNSEKNLEVTISQIGEVKSVTETNTKTNEKIETTIKEDGTKEIKEYDGTELDSWEIYDKDGKLTGEASVDIDGKVEKFEFYDGEGRLQGICYEEACQGKPDNNQNIWVTTDAACTGSKSNCFDKQGNPKTPQWCSEDNCGEQAQKGINSKEWEGFWRGETTTQKTIGAILGLRPGWEALSTWWMPETTKKWQKWASETFDKILLAEYVVPAAVCDYDEKHKVKKPGESAVFIEIAPGITQHVGSIQAEKTPKAGPALCSEEMPCQIGECREDGICYEDEKVVEAIFYKITWGVTSPSDESFTPYLDENMIAVKYNIQLKGVEEIWLYPADSAGNDRTLQLENGESDRDTYLTYSPNDYSEACVIFGAPPKDLKGDEVKEFCADFVVSTEGEIEWKDSGKRGSEGTVKVNDLGRKQI